MLKSCLIVQLSWLPSMFANKVKFNYAAHTVLKYEPVQFAADLYDRAAESCR